LVRGHANTLPGAADRAGTKDKSIS
jgi:hypothetical protein